MTAYSLRTAGIEIVEELAPDLAAIEADYDQLAQVIVNLLVNAHHALLERDEDRQLVLRTSADGRNRSLRIEVEDNGPGIARRSAGASSIHSSPASRRARVPALA